MPTHLSRPRLALFALTSLLSPVVVGACSSTPGAGGGEASKVDSNGDGVRDELGVRADGPGDLDVDTDGDGEADARGVDLEGDGLVDALDTDGDGVIDVYADGFGPSSGNANLQLSGIGDTGGGGEAEICDGEDNDLDGIIDNVDAGGDGICDCLTIGTIGTIGPWSDGGDIFATWLQERSPIRAYEIGDQQLTEDLLLGLNIIVVLRADTTPLYGPPETPAHHEFSDGEVDALETWVRAGGGLMTTIGYQGDESQEIINVNRLLDPLGGGYDGTNLNLSGFLGAWDDEHPLASGIEQIFVDNGVAPLTTNGTTVARDQNGNAGVVALQADLGRVVVFGDEWLTYDSEWEDTEDQQVELLWLNLMKWLSPPMQCQVAIPPQLVR